jgi:hypothetical protein
MMNNGDFTHGERYNIEYTWQSGLFAIVRNVPPDRHGVIPEEHVAALNRLRKNAHL